MTDSKLLDSSVWIAYLTKGIFQDIIDSDNKLFISSLSLFEIKKKLLKDKIDKNEIEENISLIKKRNLIIYPDEKVAEKAAEISVKNDLASMDSLIYASAIINNCELITLDNDFRNLERAKVLSIN